MWQFICGLIAGMYFGVVLMCMLQINRANRREKRNED
ncbi:MAG: DUF3789 domain-containing protein [Lachnospiraceae bacterium]|nr:DUF3789 domain-containing protein [Lachnospiraceae bacterium]